ncbi:transforming growth factor beta regulator 1 [Haplosporangium sp. Z 767]|nr:transforming growth factor beta regulator 1 [Haplosporangium sp. Z 11]KAF9186520.1 transforming growth factor beta regulator 1 [Haplosporangium sp. Z 767]
MNGSGPSSDSDTSMDDMSDFDDMGEEDRKDGQHSDQQLSSHSRSAAPRTNASDRKTAADRGRSDIPSGAASTSTDRRIEAYPISNGVNGMNNGDYTNHTSGIESRQSEDIKRADRGQPRHVVPLETNPDGSLNYPIVVGKGSNEVIIENMGRIVWNGRGYHNHRYIFPVGFRSKKQYTSLSDTSKKTYFISEILDGGEQPIFQITLEDMPEKVFRHSSSSGAWELALKGLMKLGFNAKTHASGPDMYGLTNLGVIKYIQEMPNAHRCRRYMPMTWIVDKDHTEGEPVDGEHGSKSPGRKKRINNSLYASNHEVLISSMEEEAAKSGSASRPYTPRKYTKRKINPPTEQAPNQPQSRSTTAPPVPQKSVIEIDSEAMEDVKQEVVPPTIKATTPTSMPTPTPSTQATPRSIKREEYYHPDVYPIPSTEPREKNTHHRYEHRYEHPLMEP